MSRSPRRRKDTQWCRCCDSALVARKGLGKCPDCGGRYQSYKLKRQAPQPDKE